MVKQTIQGKIKLDKKLKDERRMPRALYPPDEEDVLIIDQHTDENDLVQYTKTVGVAKRVENVDGKTEFEWVVTDPALRELVSEAEHPERLFQYSPEFRPINITEKYDQGEYGQLKYIAITNMANDDEAITTRIKNIVKNVVNGNNVNEGDEMDKEEIEALIDSKYDQDSIDEMKQKLGELDEIKEKLDGFDFEGLKTLIEGFDQVKVNVEDLQKNVEQITDESKEERDKLVKNIVTNGGLKEETVKLMKMTELRTLNEKLSKHSQGSGHTTDPTKEKTVVDEINEQYGMNIGESLNQ